MIIIANTELIIEKIQNFNNHRKYRINYIEKQNILYLLSLSRPLTPSGHFCQTFSPAFVLGQHKYESKTIGQKKSVESEKKSEVKYRIAINIALFKTYQIVRMMSMPSNKKNAYKL